MAESLKNKRMIFSHSILQLIKFGVVGVANTLLTATTIWLLMKVFHASDYTANIIGYIVGLINSFIWNRKWTFLNSESVKVTLFKFIFTFLISYFVQLGNLYLLLHYTQIDSYLCQLMSIVVYTSINFILNKYYTFKDKKQ